MTKYLKRYHHGGTQPIFGNQDYNDFWSSTLTNIQKKVEEFQENGSQWKFDRIMEIRLQMVRYNPSRGKKYFQEPDKIRVKKCIINIQNADENCFLLSVGRHQLYHKGKIFKLCKNIKL